MTDKTIDPTKVADLLRRLQEVLDCAPVILYDRESDSYACAFCGDIQTDWIHAKDCKWAALEKAYEAMEDSAKQV